MTLTDPISEMITTIRNGLTSRKKEVSAWDSKLKTKILEILKKENFIEDFKKEKHQGKDILLITLKYFNNEPAISNIRKISKPGRRIYVSKTRIPNIKRKKGIPILSTSRGLLTGGEAEKIGVGGEVIIEVW